MKGKFRKAAERASDFIAGRGFYIVLFLCIAAIGVSGYILFFSDSSPIHYIEDNAVVETEPVMENRVMEETEAAASVDLTIPASEPTAAPKPTQKPAASKPVFAWPSNGEILVDFADSELVFSKTLADWRTHPGIDIKADIGSEVMSISAGVVKSVENDDLMGMTVTIDHGDELFSYYANLAAVPTVKAGDKVATGDVIGAVGSTALKEVSELPHLHFEMILHGTQINPKDYLPVR